MVMIMILPNPQFTYLYFIIQIVNYLELQLTLDYIRNTINNLLMRILLFLLLLALTSAFSHSAAKPTLLRNVEIELHKMIAAYAKGDSSNAFSIAVKIHFAVQALHADLQLPLDRPPIEQINCQQTLTSLVAQAASADWQENFEKMRQMMSQLQQSCTNSNYQSPENGGFENKCAICVVVLRVMENYVSYHKVSAADFVNKQFCELFDGAMRPTCEAFVHFAGPVIIDTLVRKQPSDKACLSLGLCKNKDCKIIKQKIQEYNVQIGQNTAPAPWEWLVHLFVDHFGNSHFPAFDLDNDTYSDISTFRGYHWRGSDCNEVDATVYPGRKTGSHLLDRDCNGIFGLDNRGRLYEDKFCSQYKRMGVAVIGDSAGAHFSIPEKFFNVTMMHKGSFSDLLPRLADELDLPHESGYTGHTNTPYPSHSIYKYLRNWNLCNNNDFQNIGVNGGDSGNTQGNIKALNRGKEDFPLLMFLELIGNDVCKKSFDSMRKPADFKANILKLLDYIDHKVPAGSHLVILGLGDGDLLYENLHDSIHPLNVTYSTVYDFLNCLNISPCWGWLNSNDTVRDFTTRRAQNLSKVYKQIIAEKKYNNFDMVYYDFPAMEILERKIVEGGDPKAMIERCDGFHPNGLFHSFLADWLWVKIKMEHPEWIGAQNPHNEEIRHIFGLEDLK